MKAIWIISKKTCYKDVSINIMKNDIKFNCHHDKNYENI